MSKKIITIILSSISFFNVYAQNLPKVQETSLRAPDNVKIDGKPNEWNNQLQAYNPATDLFYTIANDDKNLYLVIQAKNLNSIRKFGQKGITFTIQKSGNKEYKNGMAITYPTAVLSFVNIGGSYSLETADSLALKSNNLIPTKAKEIAVTGIKNIDSTISIYNEHGIKAVCLFDNKRVLTYELTIPLKVLGLSLNDSPIFAYNIRLNGLILLNTEYNNTESEMVRNALAYATSVMSAPTDFWGKYTLKENN